MIFLFRLLLRLLPSDFDPSDLREMEQMFAMRSSAAQERGVVAWFIFVLREFSSIGRIAVFHRRPVPTSETEPLSFMEHIFRELHHAVRRLLRTPAFTLAAVLTLAVAIGANTAIFTLLERVVIRPLPYASGNRLVAIDHGAPGVKLYSDLGTTVGLYEQYAKLPAVEAIGLYDVNSATLSVNGDPEHLTTLSVTPSIASVLSVKPALGRWFTEDEAKENGPPLVVLNYALWQRRFAADPHVIGSTVRIDGDAHTVIGVMPRGFAFPDAEPQLMVPLRYDNKFFGGFNYRAVARVRAGTTLTGLRAEQNRIIGDLPARFPSEPKLTHAMADAQLNALPVWFRDQLLGGVSGMMWVLLASVAIVLMIACANLANLFLVRADGRHRDVAVRRALGAGSRSISAFFLSESIVISITGGLLGLLLAYVSVRLLIVKGPVAIPRVHEIRIDGWGVLFATSVSLLAGIAVGMMPLLGSSGNGISAVLQESGRGNTASVSRMHARKLLMGAQLALAAVLLIGAALMLQSFKRLQAVDPGFRADNRLIFKLGLSETKYPTREAAAAFNEQVMTRLSGLPGVTSVALTTSLPLGDGGQGDPLAVRNHPDGLTKLQAVVKFRRVSSSFFNTLSIPVRAGRALDASDVDGHDNAVVIDDALASIYFPGEDPLGKEIRPFGVDSGGWLRVVGVAGNTATTNLREVTPEPHMYLPLRSDADGDTPSLHNTSYVLQTKGDPLTVVRAVRSALAGMDPTIAIARPERMTNMVLRADARTRFTMILLVIAALVSLSLGLVGVYAVISYAVSQRTNEIGVRLALGARPAQVAGMILRESGPIVVAGIATGIVAGVAGARTLRALLFGVAWNDALTYVAVALILLVVALAACWLPARRAARVSPLESLR